MSTLAFGLSQASRVAAWMIGAGAVGLALASFSASVEPSAVLDWLWRTLGGAFLALLVGLVAVTLVSWAMILRGTSRTELWLEAGLHAASGISTVALTFTLLGISLGIGSLAGQALTPETVQSIISELTAKFSLAFFTSVVGLPVATALRALLLVTHAAKSTPVPTEFKQIGVSS
ncbi:MAG: hypothetical protein O3A96_12025 [Proteobacteria bacterium]|nr:hypothetical protein [Pseudomonadota bacterium]